MFRTPLILLPLLLCLQVARAQNCFFNAADVSSQDSFPKNGFLQVRYQVGKLSNSGTQGIKYIEANPVQSVDVRYGLFGYGRRKWHQLHHYPTYGVGVGKFWFSPVHNILGNPLTTYLFFDEPVVQFKRSSLGYDFSIGLSYLWKPYDTQTNPEQKAIGSSVNVLVGFALQYEFKFSDRLDVMLGAGVNHFSNGRMRSPNRGLNLYGVDASVRYRLKPNKPVAYKGADLTFKAHERIQCLIDPFKPMYEFYVVGSAGIATTFKDKDNPGKYFLVASGSLDVARHYSYNGKYGIGLDWFYDRSLKEQYDARYSGNVPSRLLYWPGIHLSHEYMVHRWTLVTQGGVNLKVRGDKGSWYGRIALRYDISKRIFLRMGVRLYNNFISDFVESGVGYAFYRQ